MGTKILHVEDDSDFADLTATFLEQTDERFTVESAHNPKSGLGKLENEDFDCIVSDYDMPVKNGIEFLKTVREDYPELPFILFTGKGSETVASDAISAGVTDYLQKERGADQYTVLANRIANAVEATHARQERKRFKAAVEATKHSVYITDRDGVIQYVNSAFEDITGYTADEAIGNTPRIRNSGEHDSDYYEEMWETILNGKTWRNEFINETKHGERYAVDQTIDPVTDDSGEITHFVAANIDITENKARQQKLEILEEAIDNAHSPLVLTDPQQDDNPMVYVNEAFEDLTGYDEADILRRNCRFMQGDETDSETVAKLREAIDNEERITVEIRNYRNDGTMFWNELTVEPVYDTDGTLVRFLGTQRDITDRKQTERELREQNEALSRERDRLDEFASRISHDLQSPLSVVQGNIELAKDECDTPYLETAESALSRMDRLIEDLLTLASRGEVVEETEPVAVAQLAPNCWSMVETQDATLEIETDQRLYADPDRLRDVCENLFRNAVEHGGTDVTVRIGELPDKNGLYIEDDGQGIPPDDRDRIFESGYSTADDGTGFGLAIVRRIVEAHGWTLAVTASADGGARFEVSEIEFVDDES